MSDTTATLREKIVKAGTWTFLAFIFIIIVFSFGMPDVLGTKSKIDAYNAAKVGSDFLTKGEVAEYQKRLEDRMSQNMKGLDEKSRKMFEDMTRGGRSMKLSIARFLRSCCRAQGLYLRVRQRPACSPLSTRSSFQNIL
jgi:hypothetical protein